MKKKNLFKMVSKNPSALNTAEYLFDEGSTGSYVILDNSIPSIRITPIKHWAGNWAWWCLRSRYWKGKKPQFLIDKTAHYSFNVNEKLCVWATSNDTDDWHLFDHQEDTGSDLKFYNDTRFPSGTIYIAALPMYPFSRVQRKVREWLTSSSVSITLSGSTGGIVGYSTSRSVPDGSGRTVPALPYYGIKISAGSGTKNTAVITTYNHPSETPGPYQLEGALSWLLADSLQSVQLLKYFNFYVYPCINPQGVWSGYFRSSPCAPTTDHNRMWDTSGSYEDVDKLISIMRTDTSASADMSIDFHSWMSAGATPFLTATASSAPMVVELLAKIKSVRPAYDSQDSDISTSLKARVKAELGTLLDVAPEIDGEKSITPTEYKNIGKDVFRGLELMNREGWFPHSPAVGSRLFNGTTDRIDWGNIANLTGSPMTISMWANVTGVPVSANGYLFNIHTAGSTGNAILSSYATNRVSFIIYGAGGTYSNHWCDGSNGGQTFPMVGEGWQNILITWSGSPAFTGGSAVHCYKNGVERLGADSDMTLPPVSASGFWSLGGRMFDDARNYVGNMAHFAVWNRILTENEISLMAQGCAPTYVPNNILFYWKGDTISLANETSGSIGTADGTTFVSGSGNGPGIIY